VKREKGKELGGAHYLGRKLPREGMGENAVAKFKE